MADTIPPSLLKIEASCAICGAPSSYPECPHEAHSLHLALDQALERWSGMSTIKYISPNVFSDSLSTRPLTTRLTRDWVLQTSRSIILSDFSHLRAARLATLTAYLQSLPCYTIYHRYPSNPPISPPQLHLLLSQIRNAEVAFQAGIDEDWQRCCGKYPDVLDYFLRLIEVRLPRDGDVRVREPVFGSGGQKRLEGNGGGGSGRRRSRHRRRSRGRTRTPPAPDAPRRR